jgi:hypothetical protein
MYEGRYCSFRAELGEGMMVGCGRQHTGTNARGTMEGGERCMGPEEGEVRKR